MTGLRCGITGASGYVGSCIAKYLTARGCVVLALGRGPSASIPFSLEAQPKVERLRGLDALIHCAFDFKPQKWEDMRRINVEGSTRLFRAAKDAGIKKIIFISTMSAFPGCTSNYGRAKLEIEEEARKSGVFIIRPGLIYGKDARSVFGKIRAIVNKFPAVPLIDTGKRKLYLCHNQDLGALIYQICAGDLLSSDVPITAANETGFSFKDILKTMAHSSGKKLYFVPFPQFLLFFGLNASEKIGLNQGIRSDSFVSLLNLDPNPDFTVTKKSGVVFRPFSLETMNQ